MAGQEQGKPTLCSGGMLVQQTTTPLKGNDGSNKLAPASGESGDVVIAALPALRQGVETLIVLINGFRISSVSASRRGNGQARALLSGAYEPW